MTIQVRIGSYEREITDASPAWINEQIDNRRNEGVAVCVQVIIDQGEVKLALATTECMNTPGGSRPLNPKENEIVALWEKLHLNEKTFTGGNLVAFLKQVS